MQIEPILRKIHTYLTQEEHEQLIKGFKESPEKVLTALQLNELSETDRIVQNILKDITKGIMEHGRYNYYDKGIDTVVNLDAYIDDLQQRDFKEVEEILFKLAKFEDGESSASYILRSLDLPQEKWDELVNDEKFHRLL